MSGRQLSGTRAVLGWFIATAAVLAAAPGWAQFDRLRDDIELKGLDMHPRGSLLEPREPWMAAVRPRDAVLYGLLDVGLARTLASARTPCRPKQEASSGIENLSASHWGVRTRETLGGGWRAYLRLEQSIAVDTGGVGNDCAAFDRAALVGLWHRRLGAFSVGLQEQPASQAALLGDPWEGATRVWPGELAYLCSRRVVAGGGVGDAPSRLCLGRRSDRAIAWRSPEAAALPGLRVEALGTLTGGAEQSGFSLRYEQGLLAVALGHQRWSADDAVTPLSLRLNAGAWVGYAALSSGRAAGDRFQQIALGAAYTVQHHPWDRWRVAIGEHRWAAGGSAARAAMGWERGLSRRTAVHAEFSLPAGGSANGHAVGVGIRHGFTL